MSTIAIPPSLDLMLAAWNEPDASKVRMHLDKALTGDVYFVDPSIITKGIDEFERNVHEVHKRVPGAAYTRVSEVDSHNNLFRYHWAIHVGGKLAVQGFDVSEIRDGKVSKVMGFFGDLPLSRAL